MHRTHFITEAEAMKEDFKGRTNYWVCRPEITNAKDLQTGPFMVDVSSEEPWVSLR